MRFDTRFSDPAAVPTPYEDAVAVLEAAESYWITTLRADGRPHVTPLIGAWHDGAFHFTTGLEEQKGRNLTRDGRVAVTTGTNAWADGLDIVVEGVARRLTGSERLRALAAAIEAKYGAAWRFEATDDGFTHDGVTAAVFRVHATKVLAFAKRPHGQTSYRFEG